MVDGSYNGVNNTMGLLECKRRENFVWCRLFLGGDAFDAETLPLYYGLQVAEIKFNGRILACTDCMNLASYVLGNKDVDYP